MRPLHPVCSVLTSHADCLLAVLVSLVSCGATDWPTTLSRPCCSPVTACNRDLSVGLIFGNGIVVHWSGSLKKH